MVLIALSRSGLNGVAGTGFSLREVQYLVDEAQEVSPRGIHAAQGLERLFCAEARCVGDHHFG